MSFKRVYAITPNPALDINGVVSKIVENEKNYVLSEERYPGGNAVNSAQVLSNLGYPVKASGFLGGGVGQQIESLLKNAGVNSDFVKIKDETRVNITISNHATKKQTRFSFLGPSLKETEKGRLFKKLTHLDSSTLLMLSGSFPPKFTIKDALKIMERAHQKKIACIVDVPSKHLRKILAAKPLMIKPNLSEFEELVGKKLTKIPQIVSAARSFLKNCPIICISSVERGSLLVTRGATFYAKSPKVKVISTVGAGDSMVGAMAAEMIQQKLSYDLLFNDIGNISPSVWKSIISLGMGAALATITLPGTCIGKRREILMYSKKIQVKQLS